MTDISKGLLDSLTLDSEGGQVSSWDVRPFQLVSLLEMLDFYAGLFYYALRDLMRLEQRINRAIEKRGGEDFINQHETGETHRVLEFVRREAERALLGDATRRIETHPLTGIHPKIHNAVKLNELQWELKALREAIGGALFFRTFLLIPDDKKEYYDGHRKSKKMPPLFGKKVHSKFKSTRNDVAESGNCYATGRYTACVFHCMRVVEKGLHALVHHLNKTFGTNINFLPKAIEDVNWGVIIPKVKKEIDELVDPNRKPPLSKSDVKFYSALAIEFRYFQKAWRDDVSHSRSWFDDPNEVKVIMEHAKQFMEHLTVRVSE
jgi:hypothetical protein